MAIYLSVLSGDNPLIHGYCPDGEGIRPRQRVDTWWKHRKEGQEYPMAFWKTMSGYVAGISKIASGYAVGIPKWTCGYEVGYPSLLSA